MSEVKIVFLLQLNISFVDDAEIYEYPSEISLLVEEFSTIGGSAQVGHNTPTLSGKYKNWFSVFIRYQKTSIRFFKKK